jgi:hypothetical protein
MPCAMARGKPNSRAVSGCRCVAAAEIAGQLPGGGDRQRVVPVPAGIGPRGARSRGVVSAQVAAAGAPHRCAGQPCLRDDVEDGAAPVRCGTLGVHADLRPVRGVQRPAPDDLDAGVHEAEQREGEVAGRHQPHGEREPEDVRVGDGQRVGGREPAHLGVPGEPVTVDGRGRQHEPLFGQPRAVRRRPLAQRPGRAACENARERGQPVEVRLLHAGDPTPRPVQEEAVTAAGGSDRCGGVPEVPGRSGPRGDVPGRGQARPGCLSHTCGHEQLQSPGGGVAAAATESAERGVGA